MNQINIDDWFIALEHPSDAIRDKRISIADLVGAVDSSTYRQAEGQLKAYQRAKGERAESERVTKCGLVLGRGKDDISVNRLLSAVVSKIHCALNITASGAVYITDLGSAHGTTVRPPLGLSKITLGPNKPKLLCNGDRITFGRTVTTGDVTHEPLELVVRLRYTLYAGEDGPKFISRSSYHREDLAQLERNILRVTGGAQSGRYGVPASLLYESEDEDPLPRSPTFSPEPSVPAHGAPVPNEEGEGILHAAERYSDEVLVHYVPSRSPSPVREDPDSTALPGTWYSYSSDSEEDEERRGEDQVVRPEAAIPEASERTSSQAALPPCWRTYDEAGDLVDPSGHGDPALHDEAAPEHQVLYLSDDDDDDFIINNPSKQETKAQTSVSVRSVRSSSSPEIEEEDKPEDYAEWDEDVDEDAGMEDEVDELDEDDLDHEAEYEEEYDGEEEADEKEEEEEAVPEPTPAPQPAARVAIVQRGMSSSPEYDINAEMDALEARQIEWAEEEDHEPEPVPEDELHELDELEDDHPDFPEEEAEPEFEADQAPAMVSAGVQTPCHPADAVDQSSQTDLAAAPASDASEENEDDMGDRVYLTRREQYGCNWPGTRSLRMPHGFREALEAEKKKRVKSGGKLGSAVFKAVLRAKKRAAVKERQARKREASADLAGLSSSSQVDESIERADSGPSTSSEVCTASSTASDGSYWGPHPFGVFHFTHPFPNKKYTNDAGRHPEFKPFRYGGAGFDEPSVSAEPGPSSVPSGGASWSHSFSFAEPQPSNQSLFGGASGTNRFSFEPERTHIPSNQARFGGASGTNPFSFADLERSHIPSSSADSSSDGPITPKYKLRPLKRTFSQARLDESDNSVSAGPTLFNPTPNETLPAYRRTYEHTIIVAPSPAKRLKRVASAIGLIALGAAIGSVGTIAGLMQFAE